MSRLKGAPPAGRKAMVRSALRRWHTPLRMPKGSVFAILSRGSSAIFAFGSTFVLARLLGADSYGSYAFAVAMLNLLVLFALVGLDALTPRELSIAIHKGEAGVAHRFLKWTSKTVWLASLFIAGIMQVILLWNPLGWASAQVTATRIILLGIPLLAFLRLARGRLQAIDRAPMGIFFELGLWNALLFFGSILLLVVPVRLSSYAAVVHVLTLGIAAVLSSIAFRRALKESVSKDVPARREWRRMAWNFALLSLATFLLTQADILLVGTIATPEETGAYAVAVRSAGLTLLILQPLQQIAAPHVARAWNSGDKTGAGAIARRSARLSVLFAVPLLVAFFGAPELFLSLFGEEYSALATGLRLLTCAQLLLVILGPVQMGLAMTGHEWAGLWLTVLGVSLSLPLGYALYGWMGVTGVAVARLVSAGTLAVGGWWILRKGGLRSAPFW